MEYEGNNMGIVWISMGIIWKYFRTNPILYSYYSHTKWLSYYSHTHPILIPYYFFILIPYYPILIPYYSYLRYFQRFHTNPIPIPYSSHTKNVILFPYPSHTNPILFLHNIPILFPY